MNVLNPPPHTILSLEEKDAAAIVSLEQECFSTSWTEKQYRTLLRETARMNSSDTQIPSWQIWGIKQAENELAGYISLGVYSAIGELEIVNLAVRRSSRRQGIGKALLLHSLFWGRQSGFEKIMLEVRESNAPALALYRSSGFLIAGRRKGYYHPPREDALILSCLL